MSVMNRKRFANSLEEQSALSEDWQTIVENGCEMISEREAISFGLQCVCRVLDSWTDQFKDDSRVVEAVEAVERWCDGESENNEFTALSISASDAAVEVDDPSAVPSDPARTRAVQVANAASSLADAVSSTYEPNSSRQLGPDCVPLAVAYAASFSLNASKDPAEEKKWQRRLFLQILKAELNP